MSDRLLLNHAATRASQQPFFLGWALARYIATEGLADSELARRLGCDPAQLPLIRLCRRPDSSSATFASDVLRIADRFGLDATGLAELLRQVDALDALQRGATDDGALLAAARDRDEPDGDC